MSDNLESLRKLAQLAEQQKQAEVPADTSLDQRTALNLWTYCDSMREASEPITEFGDLDDLVRDMFRTMAIHNGVGLAGVQVGYFYRIAVIDTRKKDERFVLCNPVIEEMEGHQRVKEGCLSIPGFHAFTTRPKEVVVRFQDQRGEEHRIVADGLLAQAVCHEVGHMDGEFYTDHAGLSGKLIIDKMRKKQKQHVRLERRQKREAARGF